MFERSAWYSWRASGSTPGGGCLRFETPWTRCGLRSSEPDNQRLAVGVVAVALDGFHELDSVIEALYGF